MKRAMSYLMDHPVAGYFVAGLLFAVSVVGIALQLRGASA